MGVEPKIMAEPTKKSNKSPAWRSHDAGRDALKRGELEKAVESFRGAIEIDPTEGWFYHSLGKALAGQLQFEDAEEQYRQAVKLDPAEAWFYHGLGKALAGQTRYADAEEQYRQAVKLDPSEGWFLYSLGLALREQGLFDEAVGVLKQAINLLPGEATFYKERARIHVLTGQISQAVDDMERGKDLVPDDPESHAELGNLLISQNRCDEAIPFLQRAVELDTANPWFQYNLADALAKVKQYGESIRWLHSALDIDPQESLFFALLAKVLIQDGKREEAAHAYRDAIELQPDAHWLRCFLGDVLADLGKLDEAQSCYRDAVRLQLSDSDKSRLATEPSPDAGPDFLIIGFPKCGTTALHVYLNEHEDILPAARKEPKFFSTNFYRGLDWYRAQFPVPSVLGAFLTGEGSTNYSVHPDAPGRIHEYFPNAKLIVLVRNPVERAVSDFAMWKSTGWEKRSFEQAIKEDIDALKAGGSITSPGDKPTYVASGLYNDHLTRWSILFEPENLLVLRSEDLQEQPAETVAVATHFLGLANRVSSAFEPINVGKRVAIDDVTRAALARYYEPHNQALEENYGVQVSAEEGCVNK